MLHYFLLYSKANQPYVYIYPLSRTSLPSHLILPSHPSRSAQSNQLSSLCYAAASHQLSVLHMEVYGSIYNPHGSVYATPISQFFPTSLSPAVSTRPVSVSLLLSCR